MKVKSEIEVAQSYRTLCDSMDFSLSGSSVHGILQARVKEWVAIAFSSDMTARLISLMISFYINYLYKDPITKYSYILKYRDLEL